MGAAGMAVNGLIALAGRGEQLLLHSAVCAPELTFKGEEVEPEHVEGGHAGSEEAHGPEQREAAKGLAQDFVFAPKTGQWRDAADGHTTDEEGAGGDGHV